MWCAGSWTIIKNQQLNERYFNPATTKFSHLSMQADLIHMHRMLEILIKRLPANVLPFSAYFKNIRANANAKCYDFFLLYSYFRVDSHTAFKIGKMAAKNWWLLTHVLGKIMNSYMEISYRWYLLFTNWLLYKIMALHMGFAYWSHN